MEKFKLVSPFKPTGDQPEAIEALANGIENGLKEQVLLGVTGSGKTFTMANVIAKVNRPTLILEPNKTLAAQTCSEMREFFPENSVNFFVSYNRSSKKSVQNSIFYPYKTVFLGRNNTKTRFVY